MSQDVYSLSGDKSKETCTWTVDKVDDHFFTLRSDCCPYAFNWYPNCQDSCWEFFVGSQPFEALNMTYVDGTMDGMCGQCNGDNIDDIRYVYESSR